MSRRCLCEICTCGRHHCPHGTTRIYKTSGVSCPTTEYLEKYPTYGNVLPPQSLKPKQELQACRARMEGVTTFKSDYRPYEIVKQPRHVPEEYKPKQGEIDLGTTYKRDFNSYKVQPVAIVRPLERQQVKKGKLDTVPTYKDNRDSFRMPEDRVRKWKAARMIFFAPFLVDVEETVGVSPSHHTQGDPSPAGGLGLYSPNFTVSLCGSWGLQSISNCQENIWGCLEELL